MTEANNKAPVIIADTGPLLRLAAADLLDYMRLTNRRVVLIDMVEDEACKRNPQALFAKEIAEWINRNEDLIQRVETDTGFALQQAKIVADENPDDPKAQDRFYRLKKNGGERAIIDYITETLKPDDLSDALIIYEDDAVPKKMKAAGYPAVLVSTKEFISGLEGQGMNINVKEAIERIENYPKLGMIGSTYLRLGNDYLNKEPHLLNDPSIKKELKSFYVISERRRLFEKDYQNNGKFWKCTPEKLKKMITDFNALSERERVQFIKDINENKTLISEIGNDINIRNRIAHNSKNDIER